MPILTTMALIGAGLELAGAVTGAFGANMERKENIKATQDQINANNQAMKDAELLSVESILQANKQYDLARTQAKSVYNQQISQADAAFSQQWGEEGTAWNQFEKQWGEDGTVWTDFENQSELSRDVAAQNRLQSYRQLFGQDQQLSHEIGGMQVQKSAVQSASLASRGASGVRNSGSSLAAEAAAINQINDEINHVQNMGTLSRKIGTQQAANQYGNVLRGIENQRTSLQGQQTLAQSSLEGQQAAAQLRLDQTKDSLELGYNNQLSTWNQEQSHQLTNLENSYNIHTRQLTDQNTILSGNIETMNSFGYKALTWLNGSAPGLQAAANTGMNYAALTYNPAAPKAPKAPASLGR